MNETRVYSYRRFSSGRQASGHSLERQSASARAWCAEQGLTLDEDLVISDLGVSAYSGKNASDGALAVFLAAAKKGLIPSGSILLVESLDRLSRSAIPEAIALLTSIVATGVRVVSMIDGKEWNQETIRDTMNFMMSVLLFSRAHEESATKAKRVRAAVMKKREANLPVVTTVHGSGWLIPKQDLQGWLVDQEKADSVRKVFEKASEGYGGVAIARMANEIGWKLPWRVRANTNVRWEHTQISRLLRDRRTLGEWQPKRMLNGELVADGQPVLNYFPRIISDELWYSVQNSLAGRTGPVRLRGIKGDIFSGLLYCSCGERMERKTPGARGYARYYCLGCKAGVTNKTKCPSLGEAVLVREGLPFLAAAESSSFSNNEAAIEARNALATAQLQLAEFSKKADILIEALEKGGESSYILNRLNAVEKEKATVEALVLQKKAALAALPVGGVAFGHQIAAEAELAISDKSAVQARHKIASALALILDRIVWHGTFLIFKTKKGDGFAQLIDQKTLARVKRRDRKLLDGMKRVRVKHEKT
jgi:DNA invertase Pin-like site-specific DNA recombinase